MQYLVSFVEGIITFISPCLLPMLPVYLSYFAGGGERSTKKTLLGASGFVLGFTAVFTAMGALAGTLGGFLKQYETIVNIILGLIVIVFGLNYIGIFKLKIFSGTKSRKVKTEMGFFSAFLFGVVFSVGWTPCVGAFLGSALALASSEGNVMKGVIMLLLYSLGLGVPFLLSAVLIDKLKGAFTFIKKNYKVINTVSGIFLVIIGVLMMTGLMNKLLSILS
ncbi:MAG: sulfite exporter TauE/SafE family protein [Clostridia bacterium]|nr:sulfite exporter TauE/SafE family protein [Clostridia bacterium]